MANFKIVVKTADRLFAGTDANVLLKLHGRNGEESENLVLNHIFRNDFEQGAEDVFHLRGLEFSADVDHIELWRDDFGISSAWMVDHVEVTNTDTGASFIFPVLRWVEAHRHYFIKHLDTSLPQYEPFPEMRAQELQEKRKVYQFKIGNDDLPAQVSYFSFYFSFCTTHRLFLSLC